jgi:Domain of unknown function (DUF4824)
MNWRRLGAGVGLLVLTNAVVLAGVAYNRAGESDVEITLTEREIPLSYSAFRGDENTGLSLQLRWQSPNMRWHSAKFDPGPAWFDQAKLEAIGYDCSIPLTDSLVELYYDKLLPQEAYVVLEYGGQAWTAWLTEWERDLGFMNDQLAKGRRSKQDVERLREAYERLPKTGSRLLAVDVGIDPIQLRQRYPAGQRFIITKAQVRLTLVRAGKTESGESRPAHLRGNVTHLLVDEVHVPSEWREALERLTYAGSDRERIYPNTFAMQEEYKKPRYEVTLRYGKRYEPWITSIRPLTNSP